VGQNFGFPYCHQGDFADPQFGWGKACDDFDKPVLLLGPHSAPLGMRFYTGTMFPQKYQGVIFIARHGPWNRTKKYAADVVAVFLNPNGTVKPMEPEIPSLGGQPSFFVVAQLFLFREGRRDNLAMIAAAKGLTNSDLTAFAERVTKLPPPPPPEDPPDSARFARGRSLTLRNPCGVCHNPDFSGREQMPRLTNQREDYLLKSMREYKSGVRLGYGGAMAQELAGLTDQI